jgi:hypothetical protein
MTPSRYAIKLLFVFIFFALTACKKDDGITTDDDLPLNFTGEIEWAKTFGGSREDDANAIIETPDGGYAIVGYTLSNDGDITDKTSTVANVWVFKVNQEGELQWSKTYGGSADDRGTKIINTNDGGFAVIGYTRSTDGDVSFNNGFYDFWLLKLDGSGNLLWEKTFGFSGNDQGQSLLQTSDGGYFLTGFMDFDGMGEPRQSQPFTQGVQHGVGEFWAVKTDASGNESWNQFYGGTDNDRAFDVVQTPDGGFMMVGNSESDDFDITNPLGSYDYWVVKIDAIGNLQWQQNYGGSGIEIAYAITRTMDGNYLVLGDTRSTDQQVTNPRGNADAWLIKINETGDLLWQKSYGGSQFDTGRSITEKPDGTLIVFGTSRSNDQDVSNNYGQSDFWLVLANANGNLFFEKNYGGSSADFGNDAILTSSDQILIVGSSESSDFDVPNNQGGKDVLIIKLKN